MSGVALVAANYNTAEHIAHLLFSLHTTVAADLARIVIVDNGSNDESQTLLREASDAGLCTAIINEDNRYHGPALNQGFDFITQREPDVTFIWFLDSDCVVLDPLLVRRLIDLTTASGAQLVGEPVWNPWQNQMRLGLYSLLIGRSTFLQSSRFDESGDPSALLERSLRDRWVRVADFPFAQERHLVHVGRGTLRVIAERDERANRYHEWAVEHSDPHFQGVVGADALYRTFCERFDAVVPELTGAHLVDALGAR